MHIHNVTLVKISLERRPRAFVHSFGHAKHRLLPSQIPYYSYARNLVSLDHVNSTFSQLVVFRRQIVMIKIKRNIVTIEHLYKIGIKTSFTITMKINGHH